MQVKMTQLGCVDISPDNSPPAPQREKPHFRESREGGDCRVDVHTTRENSRQTTPGEVVYTNNDYSNVIILNNI